MPVTSAKPDPTRKASYHFEPEVCGDAEWDRQIEASPSATVFHSSGWLKYLRETTGGTPVRLRIESAGETEGFFCGVKLSKGPFMILGSPMRGWGTPNMGPVADPANFDADEFLNSLDSYCKANRIDFVETCCDWLDPAALERHGFRAAPDVTHQIQLTTAEEAWSNLYKTTRNYVRRAEKNGLTVERNNSEAVLAQHFEQLKAVFSKQKISPPYGVERPLAMRDSLSDKQFMTLTAMHQGRCVATYLLVWDRQTMWGLATASWPDALDLRPNELIHWRAIEMACQMGLKRYDLCGGGDYKKKYGAIEVPRVRWMRAYSAAAGIGYKAAERGWELKRKIAKLVNKLKPE